jgi:hypothetical protein
MPQKNQVDIEVDFKTSVGNKLLLRRRPRRAALLDAESEPGFLFGM